MINKYFMFAVVFAGVSVLADVEKIDGSLAASLDWKYDVQSNRTYSDFVKVSDHLKLKLVMNDFHNGTGVVSIGDQIFYASDGHADGASYSSGLFDFQFIDINGDRLKDVVFSGIVNYTGEVDDEIYEREDVVFIYLYDLEKKKYVLKYKKASFDLEISSDAGNQWWKRFYSDDRYEKFRKLDEKKDG